MIYRYFPTITALTMTLLLSGCDYGSSDNASKTHKKSTVSILGDFQSKVFQINANEHVTIFDIPGYSDPIRCIVWSNDKTNKSHMQCTSEPLGALPQSSGILAR